MIAAETLTLSATLFHADVDAWLPADFGVARGEAEKAAEWDAALRGAQRDRLGIGHPELSDAGARRRRETAGAGIAALRKVKRREEEEEPTGRGKRAASDSEDESRTRAVGKKRARGVDVFGKKGAAPAVHPLLVLKKPIPGYEPGERDAEKEAEEVPTDRPEAETTTEFVDAAAAAMSKAQAKREKRRRAKARKAGKA